jgi:alpha-D-ribose 1-methylphosphonate 5-triphosphate synthase subunit PhnL
MTQVLQIRGLSKEFWLHNQGGARIAALSNIDLEVRRGECVALVGPSGAGKSTLLRCVYGNYAASAGSIVIDDGKRRLDVVAAHPREILALRRSTIGWVSQFLRVVPRVSALDIVAEPALAAGMPAEAARRRAAELLDRLAVPERLWRLAPQTFSGGEQQRVNIARGFVLDRKLLLLDEPTASLDAENRRRVAGLVAEAKDRGSALLGIFHDLDFAREIATRHFPLPLPLRQAA